MRKIVEASKILLWQRSYLLLFLLGISMLFFILVLVPTKTIPGNSLAFQLSIFTPRDYLLLATLSTFTSLLFVMNIYIFRQKRSLVQAGQGSLGGASSVLGVVFGTAACASCVAALFGFLGLPAVFFLIKARLYIVSAAIALIVISLYFASKKVVQVCQECS